MNKAPKLDLASAPAAAKGPFQALSGTKKSQSLPAPAPKPTKAELAAKSATENAERDKKLDLVLHRFAKLL